MTADDSAIRAQAFHTAQLWDTDPGEDGTIDQVIENARKVYAFLTEGPEQTEVGERPHEPLE